MTRRVQIAAVLALAAQVLIPSAAMGSTFPGQNGHIAFLSPSDGNCLQLIKADGTGRHAPGACEPHPSLRLPSARLSPDGTRVAAPIYDLANDVYDVRNSKLDGSDAVFIPGLHHDPPFVRWSPDGTRLAIAEQFSPGSCCDAGYLHSAPADGSGGAGTGLATSYTASWSNDGRVAYANNDYDANFGHLGAVNGDGTGGATILSGPLAASPEWDPTSDRLAFWHGSMGLAVINDDGTGLQQLNPSGRESEWAPNGQAVTFDSGASGNSEIWSVAPDGTQDTNLTNHPASDRNPIWSPDSAKIAFESNRDGDYDIYVMNRDGSGVVQVTNDAGTDELQDWQSLAATPPSPGYARPKGATPFQTYLVPAYNLCSAPNRTHGPPLAFPSCNPPQKSSASLTVGTADSNGAPSKYIGRFRYDVLSGDPATPADEADVRIEITHTDVRWASDLTDYTGQLQGEVIWRITDRFNAAGSGGGSDPATVVDLPFRSAPINCAATADPSVGADCNSITTMDALFPGAISERKRTVVAVSQVEVFDGGPDGQVGTAPNTLFAKQGIFIP